VTRVNRRAPDVAARMDCVYRRADRVDRLSTFPSRPLRSG
jgi:hypothetical protein